VPVSQQRHYPISHRSMFLVRNLMEGDLWKLKRVEAAIKVQKRPETFPSFGSFVVLCGVITKRKSMNLCREMVSQTINIDQTRYHSAGISGHVYIGTFIEQVMNVLCSFWNGSPVRKYVPDEA
jgi:hypothetical protein